LSTLANEKESGLWFFVAYGLVKPG